MLAVHPLFTYQITCLPIISVKTNNYSSWTFGELNSCKDSEAFLLKLSLLCQNSTFAWGILSVGRRWNEVIIGSYCQQMLTSDRNQIKHFMKINEDFHRIRAWIPQSWTLLERRDDTMCLMAKRHPSYLPSRNSPSFTWTFQYLSNTSNDKDVGVTTNKSKIIQQTKPTSE